MNSRKSVLVILAIVLVFNSGIMAQTQDQKSIRNFQLSVLPFVGTEGRQVINHRYHFSLNLFAGITGGLVGFEAGYFMNICNGQVTGAQLAGFGNIVRGNMEGFQASGFMNLNHGNTKAFQGAGFMNSVTGSTEGFLGSGFMNIVGGSSKSFSGAGFANVTGGNFEGFAGSGFANVTGGSSKGMLSAGFVNVTGGTFEGVKLAGFANVTGNQSQGVNIAGFMNAGRDTKGLQIAGFMNVARKMQGVQIGFLNIADTIDGVPVGFLSIVNKGAYRQLELSGSDVMHISASFRIGVPVFYNIFSYGFRPFTDEKRQGFGYGIGTEIRLTELSALQIEAHTTQLRKEWNKGQDHLDMVNELRLTFGADLGSRVQLFAGPVLYNQIYRHDPEKGITGSDLSGYIIDEKHWDDYVSKWWIGARGGLRIKLN